MWDDGNGIDRAIDDAAREMTAADPPTSAGAFRARVVSRVGERKASRIVLWILAPVAVAAAILIAVRLKPDTTTEGVRLKADTTTETVRLKPDTTTEALRPDTAPADPYVVSAPYVVSTFRRTNSATPSTLGSPVALPPSEVEALAPERLTVESIQLTEIEPAESIELPQLELIAPITVAPIGEPQSE